MKKPWVAFPAYLWSSGRTAIAAPAQLNNDATCDTNMIGTGPFKKTSFDPTTGDVKVVKNPDYWRKGYPYLDGINFKPQEDSSQRIRGLQGGQFDITHDAGGLDLSEIKSTMPSAEIWNEPNGRMEVAHTLPNVTPPPLDDLNARKAVGAGRRPQPAERDLQQGHEPAGRPDLRRRRDGPRRRPQVPGARTSPRRRSSSQQYKNAHGGKFEFTIQSTFDTTTQQIFREVKRQLAPGRDHGEPAEPGRPGDDHQPGDRRRGRRVRLAQLPRPGPGHDVRVVLRRLGRELQPRQRPAAQRRPRQGPSELGHRDADRGVRGLQQAHDRASCTTSGPGTTSGSSPRRATSTVWSGRTCPTRTATPAR